ncbi:MAG: hypothetical protein LBV72_14450 [Tannerella sp.]|jgi:hypothetical protein|nr:hypothetical protein [Tannerella sp.]
MNKLWALFLCLCVLSCNDKDDEIQVDSPWAKEYLWLGKIMSKAENGYYKDANGKRATVQIYVLELEKEHYFLFNYGRSGGLMYEEMRDCKGNVIKGDGLDYQNKQPERIYPVY